MQHMHIVVAQLGERDGSFFGQLPDPFDRVDIRGNFGEYRRGIARARADFENLLAAFKQQRIGHESDDVWLGNCLAFSNWQRRIFVSKFSQGRRQKFFTWHFAHSLQNQFGAHATCGDLMLDHV